MANINLFKSKSCNKKLKKGILTKPEVIPGTSKCEKDSVSVKNGIGGDSKTFHLTNLPCPHCRQEYNNLSALKYHVRLMHSDLENKLFCYLCPMNFIEREYFKIHLWEAHNARFWYSAIVFVLHRWVLFFSFMLIQESILKNI